MHLNYIVQLLIFLIIKVEIIYADNLDGCYCALPSTIVLPLPYTMSNSTLDYRMYWTFVPKQDNSSAGPPYSANYCVPMDCTWQIINAYGKYLLDFDHLNLFLRPGSTDFLALIDSGGNTIFNATSSSEVQINPKQYLVSDTNLTLKFSTGSPATAMNYTNSSGSWLLRAHIVQEYGCTAPNNIVLNQDWIDWYSRGYYELTAIPQSKGDGWTGWFPDARPNYNVPMKCNWQISVDAYTKYLFKVIASVDLVDPNTTLTITTPSGTGLSISNENNSETQAISYFYSKDTIFNISFVAPNETIGNIDVSKRYWKLYFTLTQAKDNITISPNFTNCQGCAWTDGIIVPKNYPMPTTFNETETFVIDTNGTIVQFTCSIKSADLNKFSTIDIYGDNNWIIRLNRTYYNYIPIFNATKMTVVYQPSNSELDTFKGPYNRGFVLDWVANFNSPHATAATEKYSSNINLNALVLVCLFLFLKKQY